MKRIILICLLLISGLIGFSQSIVQRSNGLNTLDDPRQIHSKNLFIPRYSDTTAANLQKGIDSTAAIIYTYTDKSFWERKHNPKRWVQIIDAENLATSNSTINIIDSNTFSICNGQNVCDTFTSVINFNTISFITDSSVKVCKVDTTGGTVTQVCDTQVVGRRPITYIANNWVRLTNPNQFEFGSDVPTTSNGLYLTHNTYTNTGYYKMFWDGGTIYDAPHQFSQSQSFQNGSAIASFKSGGNYVIGEAENTTRLLINYSADTLDRSPFVEGYFGRAIGYSIGTNWTGHSAYGVYLDNNNAKTTGIFFHLFDSSNTDGVTIYAAPDLGGTAPILNGQLKNYKVATYKTDLSIRHYGYGSGSSFITSDTTNNKPAAYDANGNLVRMSSWIGSGGAGNPNSNIGSGYRLAVPFTNNVKTLFAGLYLTADSTTNTNAITLKADSASMANYFLRRKDSLVYATPHYVDSSISSINLITANRGTGQQISFDSGDTLYFKKINNGVFINVTTSSDSSLVPSLDTASSSLKAYIQSYSNSTWVLPFAGLYGTGTERMWFDTTVNRLSVKRNNVIYRFAIFDSVDGTTYDVDAQVYFDNLAAAGISLTVFQKTKLNDYFLGLKADTLWTKIYDQGLPIWGTAAGSAVTLKNTHTTTWVNSPTFDAAGVTGNGSSSYGNLNFSPTTAYSSQDNAHLAVYIQSNTTDANMADIGSVTLTPTRGARINTKANAATSNLLNDAATIGWTVSSSAGFFLISRTSSTNVNGYKNGSLLVGGGASTSTGLATDNFYILASNQVGSPGLYSTRKLSLWSVGSTLTSTQAINLSNRVNTLMTAFGINVY